MKKQPSQTVLAWWGVAIATMLMLLVSGLILYPETTDENILLALRVSSVTTALPFLLVFVAKPLRQLNGVSLMGQWIEGQRRYLWLILTLSHFLHLYQILLFYQFGESCSLTVWAITSPLWVLMFLFSGIELVNPQLLDRTSQASHSTVLTLSYDCGCWYIWFVFTLAFALGTAGKHLLFYNIPALILFLAGAIAYGLVWWRRRSLS